jgi:phosphatidylglycerophosphate synthase
MNEPAWGLRAWMVVIIVGRELLVTALRSFIEERGGDFSAKWSGKWKMGLQCGAAIAAFVYLAWSAAAESPPLWVVYTTAAFIWSALLMTIYTGYVYVTAAMEMVRRPTSIS